ncbi:hypothetical protein ACFQ40_00060 [Kroppenstedtia eburnea]|uniref:hypothetical protein n=1 Tax=Kroppenstedtia eburnea TaxID=714067 RepID=UPI0036381969
MSRQKQTSEGEFFGIVSRVALFAVAGGIAIYGLVADDWADYQAQGLAWWATFLQVMRVILVGFGLLLLLVLGSRVTLNLYYRRQARQDIRYLRILPSAAEKKMTANRILNLVRAFGIMRREMLERWVKGKPYFRLRFILPLESDQVKIYLGYPQDKESSVKRQLRNYLPKCEFHDVDHKEIHKDIHQKGVGGWFIFLRGRRKGLPLTSVLEEKQENLDQNLGNVVASLEPGTAVDLFFTTRDWGDLEERSEEVLEDLKEKSTRDLNPHESVQRTSISRRLTGREMTFGVTLSLWSWKPNRKQAKAAVRSVGNTIANIMQHDGAIHFWRHYRINPLQFVNPSLSINPIPLPIPFMRMTWTDNELGNLFHIPAPGHPVYEEPSEEEKGRRGYIPHLKENQRSLASWELNKGVFLGKLVHPIYFRNVCVDFEQLTKHFILTGATGMGKSSSLVEFIESITEKWMKDPENHPGFTFIDPAAETIAILMNRIRRLEDRGMKIPRDKETGESKIKYFDLSPGSSHALALNLLHKAKGYNLETIADQAAELILSVIPGGSNMTRTPMLLSKAIQSLLEDAQSHSILGIEDMFRDKNFRKKVIQNVKDPVLKRYWSNLKDEEFDAEVDPIMYRIDPLIKSKAMRRMFCQLEMALNIRKYMDEGYLVFVNILNMSKQQVRVTAGHLIHQYHYIAKQRPRGAKEHLLMIDEAHLVQIPLLAEIIAEDRKFGLGLGLITQEIDQFEDKKLLHAIRSNIGMVMSTAQNAGATNVERMTKETFSRDFLERLPERNVAIFTRSKRDDGRSHITSCVVENGAPVIYLPDGSVAPYKSNTERKELEAGMEWARSIMADPKLTPEMRPAEQVDKEIKEYLLREPEIEDPTDKKGPEQEISSIDGKDDEVSGDRSQQPVKPKLKPMM